MPLVKGLKVLALTVGISTLYLLEEGKITEVQAVAVCSEHSGSPVLCYRTPAEVLRLNGKVTMQL